MKHGQSGEVRLSRAIFRSLFRKPATIPYLGGDIDLDARCRGLLAYAPEQCVVCGLCMKDCPTGAITIVNKGTKEAREPHAYLDTGRCIFCGQCVDSCARHCLSTTSQTRLAGFSRESLTVEL